MRTLVVEFRAFIGGLWMLCLDHGYHHLESTENLHKMIPITNLEQGPLRIAIKVIIGEVDQTLGVD